jgi:hypothetical protein
VVLGDALVDVVPHFQDLRLPAGKKIFFVNFLSRNVSFFI